MEEVQNRTFLLVTLGLLALSFFSYSTHLGTGQVTAAGDDYYDCNDVGYAESRVAHGDPYDRVYDLDEDGIVNARDVELVVLEAAKHPCPDNDCLEVGRTRCDILGNLVTCAENDYGKKVEITRECPEGTCVTVQRHHRRLGNLQTGPVQYRAGECRITFRGTPY